MFRGRPPTEFIPMSLDGKLIEFGQLAQRQVYGLDVPGTRLARLPERFRKDGLKYS